MTETSDMYIKMWSFNTGGPVFSSPCIVEDHILVGTHAGALCCCASRDGTLVWRVSTTTPVYASPSALSWTTVDGHIQWCAAFASIDGNLYIVDQSGQSRQLVTLPGQVFSSPVLLCLRSDDEQDDGESQSYTVLVGCRDNSFYAVQCQRLSNAFIQVD
jgi:hypothetical protein